MKIEIIMTFGVVLYLIMAIFQQPINTIWGLEPRRHPEEAPSGTGHRAAPTTSQQQTAPNTHQTISNPDLRISLQSSQTTRSQYSDTSWHSSTGVVRHPSRSGNSPVAPAVVNRQGERLPRISLTSTRLTLPTKLESCHVHHTNTDPSDRNPVTTLQSPQPWYLVLQPSHPPFDCHQSHVQHAFARPFPLTKSVRLPPLYLLARDQRPVAEIPARHLSGKEPPSKDM